MALTGWLFRELRHQRGFAIFFTLNLMVGLTAIVCLSELKSSLSQSLSESSRTFLGGDVAVAVRRKFTPAEIKRLQITVPPESQLSRSWQFLAMVRSGDKSRLVQVKAIDVHYPMVGELGIEPKVDRQALLDGRATWAEPELLSTLEAKVGDRLSMDALSYVAETAVLRDPSRSFSWRNFAPRMYIGLEALAKSQWVDNRATMTDMILVKLADPARLPEVFKKLRAEFSDAAMEVHTADQAAREAVRALDYLADYLGLVSLVAFLLALVGSAYMTENFVRSKRKETAVLNALGLAKTSAAWTYLFQVLALSAAAAVGSVGVARLLGPWVTDTVRFMTPMPLVFQLHWQDLGLALGLMVLSTLAVAGPLLLRLRDVDTKKLLSEDSGSDMAQRWVRRDGLWLLPAALLFFFLSAAISHSWRVGSIFFGGLMAAVLVVLTFDAWIFRWAGRWQPESTSARLALWSVTRRKSASLTVLVALTLGVLLIDLIPQLQNSIQAGLILPTEKTTPSLFLFDVQDEQLRSLREMAHASGMSLQSPSPLIRARILDINGSAYERGQDSNLSTREEETDTRFRNRGVNLSYPIDKTEKLELLDGRPFSGTVGPIAEVSVEKGYAKRLHLELGDHLTFDVQGVQVPAVVTSLRKVDWSSFRPNFFILMQPGVLDDAPKTWVAGLPQMSEADKARLQSEIVERFPNVSAVDIRRVVEKVVEITGQMSVALRLLGVLVYVCGLMVLISMAQLQSQVRAKDYTLLRLIGATGPLLQKAGALEALVWP